MVETAILKVNAVRIVFFREMWLRPVEGKLEMKLLDTKWEFLEELKRDREK
jgi:hypothetical protein